MRIQCRSWGHFVITNVGDGVVRIHDTRKPVANADFGEIVHETNSYSAALEWAAQRAEQTFRKELT